jgi:hypothetical protein
MYYIGTYILTAVVTEFKIIPQSSKCGMKLNNLRTVEYLG